jgi:hypothetical protein
MKKIILASVVTALALTNVNADELADKLLKMETEISKLKKDLKKQKNTLNEVKAHDATDNIKWNVDLRTAIDSINYDMADGAKYEKKDLMGLRLLLGMEYAPDAHNIFKGKLSMNKAFGADLGVTPTSNSPFGMRGTGMDTVDWVTNQALTNGNLRVKEAFWLYLGDKAFGADIPWTMSIGRRPSTNGFLANIRENDNPQSPLGHIINVEFDGLSSKLDLSNITGVTGMSFKLCTGQGSTNAKPLFSQNDSTSYSNDDLGLKDIKLAGFIFEPYNDGQFIFKTTAFRAYDLPGYSTSEMMGAMMDPTYNPKMSQGGDLTGAALSVLIDGLTENGYWSKAKAFGSVAFSKTHPKNGEYMLGMDPTMTPMPVGDYLGKGKSGHSIYVGAQVPVLENGNFGIEYNKGSQYWKSFTYGEDTMIGSKLAARGAAKEAYFTWNFSESLSFQVRYTKVNYDYTGSNGFFGAEGAPMKISDVKAGATAYNQVIAGATAYGITPIQAIQGQMGVDEATATQMFNQMYMANSMVGSIVEKAKDLRFYIRYRF